jgi:hypothetical protein
LVFCLVCTLEFALRGITEKFKCAYSRKTAGNACQNLPGDGGEEEKKADRASASAYIYTQEHEAHCILTSCFNLI